jgi:hypothetical protein
MHAGTATAEADSASCPAGSAVAEIAPPELAGATMLPAHLVANWLKGVLHHHVASLPQPALPPGGSVVLEADAEQRILAARATTSVGLVRVDVKNTC